MKKLIRLFTLFVLLLAFTNVNGQKTRFVIPISIKTECKVDKVNASEFDCVRTLFADNSFAVITINDAIMKIEVPTEKVKIYSVLDVQIFEFFISFTVFDDQSIVYIINYYPEDNMIVQASLKELNNSNSYLKVTKYIDL